MLSYQHAYHAGNHADVLKHWTLLACVEHLLKKDKPFVYIDTHAGSGSYQLDSPTALKTGEARQGILKLLSSPLAGLESYRQAVAADLLQQRYPGSPLLVKRCLRPGDSAWLYELHPQTLRELHSHCGQGRMRSQQACHVRQEDGFQGLLSRLPVSNRRALVLIDPSYEIKSDYQQVVNVMAQAYRKMPQTLLLLWYPVVNRQWINALELAIQKTAMSNVQLFEMGVADDSAKGMTASGMIAVNPPWSLAEQFQQTMPTVSGWLARDGVSRCRFLQLQPEATALSRHQ